MLKFHKWYRFFSLQVMELAFQYSTDHKLSCVDQTALPRKGKMPQLQVGRVRWGGGSKRGELSTKVMIPKGGTEMHWLHAQDGMSRCTAGLTGNSSKAFGCFLRVKLSHHLPVLYPKMPRNMNTHRSVQC